MIATFVPTRIQGQCLSQELACCAGNLLKAFGMDVTSGRDKVRDVFWVPLTQHLGRNVRDSLVAFVQTPLKPGPSCILSQLLCLDLCFWTLVGLVHFVGDVSGLINHSASTKHTTMFPSLWNLLRRNATRRSKFITSHDEHENKQTNKQTNKQETLRNMSYYDPKEKTVLPETLPYNNNDNNNGYFQTPDLESSKRFTKSWRSRGVGVIKIIKQMFLSDSA